MWCLWSLGVNSVDHRFLRGQNFDLFVLLLNSVNSTDKTVSAGLTLLSVVCRVQGDWWRYGDITWRLNESFGGLGSNLSVKHNYHSYVFKLLHIRKQNNSYYYPLQFRCLKCLTRISYVLQWNDSELCFSCDISQ